MLDDNVVLPVCYYWAKRLIRKNVDFDELVSVAYVACKQLDNPKLVQKWAKYTMIHFLQDKKKPVVVESIKVQDSFDEKDVLDIEDVLDNLHLTSIETKVIYLKYYKGLTHRQIAEQFNKKEYWSRRKLKSIMTKVMNSFCYEN